MQITITESEIKTAIRNYILAQIAVREDHEIDVDLRATRGEDGYTALIDIHPATTPPPPSGRKSGSATSAAKSEGSSAKKGSAASNDTTGSTRKEPTPEVEPVTPAPAVSEPVAAPAAEPAQEAAQEPQEEAPAAEAPAEAEAAPEASETASAPAEEPKTESKAPVLLFKKNQAKTEDAAPAAPESGEPRRSIFSNLPRPTNKASA